MKPSVIFLDAVGTLFGVRGTVGEIYSHFAAQSGVQVDPKLLNQAFVESFFAAPKFAFPGVAPPDLPAQELLWWKAVAARAFQQVDALSGFTDFDAFFQILFDHFATPEPWFVYPEVPQVLQKWQQQGIQLGVISNFDSRLHPVLTALELSDYFETVTSSTAVGSAKPDAQVFAAALAKHPVTANGVWHIGDSWQDDYQGAEQAGLRGVWLNRAGKSPPGPTHTEIADLSRLALTSEQ